MDIDIDVADRASIIAEFDNMIPASIIKNNIVSIHPSGVYLQSIPELDTGYAALDYKKAEEFGYIKIDLLNNTLYTGLTQEQIKVYSSAEPDWSMFDYKEIVDELPHLRDHYDIVKKISPKSLGDIAIVLALIRPSKKYLIGESKAVIEKKIWMEEDTYYFKKSHAYAYAMSIIIKMNRMMDFTK
jgi:hypothetical protein